MRGGTVCFVPYRQYMTVSPPLVGVRRFTVPFLVKYKLTKRAIPLYPKRATPFALSGKPIPDINTDSKPDIPFCLGDVANHDTPTLSKKWGYCRTLQNPTFSQYIHNSYTALTQLLCIHNTYTIYAQLLCSLWGWKKDIGFLLDSLISASGRKSKNIDKQPIILLDWKGNQYTQPLHNYCVGYTQLIHNNKSYYKGVGQGGHP